MQQPWKAWFSSRLILPPSGKASLQCPGQRPVLWCTGLGTICNSNHLSRMNGCGSCLLVFFLLSLQHGRQHRGMPNSSSMHSKQNWGQAIHPLSTSHLPSLSLSLFICKMGWHNSYFVVLLRGMCERTKGKCSVPILAESRTLLSTLWHQWRLSMEWYLWRPREKKVFSVSLVSNPGRNEYFLRKNLCLIWPL